LQILIQGCLIVILVATQLWLTNLFEHQVLEAAKARAIEAADGAINGLNTMMVTKVGNDEVISNKVARALFIQKMGASEKIKEMRIFRDKQLDSDFPAGLPQEQPVDNIDRKVLATGKPEFKLTLGNDGEASLRTVMPFIASKNFRTTNCLKCHSVLEGAVLGAASVTIDVKDDLASIKQVNTLIWIGQCVLQIILYFAIGLIVHRLSWLLGGEPAYVIDIVKKIAKGNLSQQIATQTGDTTSLLAAVKQMQEERKQAEEKLKLAANVFTFAREGITITDSGGTILDVNETFSRITGYSREEVVGQNSRILKSGRQGREFYAAMWRELIEKGYWYGEIWNRRKSGEMYAEMLTISTVRNAQGDTQNYVALFSDITLLKEHQYQLEHIAHYDALTTLPNRVLLADRLRQGMAQALRRAQLLAVAYLDLDGFKAINDLHGHDAGDRLLMTVATRMKQVLREGDTLARLGGDEFVAVLLDLTDIEACVAMLTRLLVAAAQPVYVGDLVLQVSASLGVTFYPQAGDIDADQLLRQADQAMYQAKLAGKNRFHIFDAEQDRSVRGHHESLEHIRRALTEREFVLYYQPKVNMRTGMVIGAEALIRWQHPEEGLLPPVAFLPVIEDNQLAVELGEWVIETALAQTEHWHAAGLDIPVSVNVCARQLQQANFVERLCEILAAHPKIRPGDLEMEVLETSALEDLGRISKVIEDCREVGVYFALDDFGTGYSSLTYLKRLSVIQLKIDQSFVHDMLNNPDDLAILNGVLGLATAFRRQVIAEGVETVEQGTMLLQLGCELAQGYGIARPMPAHELPGWLAAWRIDPAWSNLPAVNRDDIPVLFAIVEHRAWIEAMEIYLKGERNAPPQLNFHQCHFGKWLDAEGLVRYSALPPFQSIELLHRQVHMLAAEMCELQSQGRNQEALANLGKLHDLRNALLEKLKGLVREIRK
jgi:diguanylate cyclase (GGDEF)-like protein/PAS domain S-box-containing protein